MKEAKGSLGCGTFAIVVAFPTNAIGLTPTRVPSYSKMIMTMSEKTKPDQQASVPEGELHDQVPEWLASRLRRMCDRVMEEPMPDEFAALLDQLDKKERGQQETKERE
jgi:hypothetical protein